MVIKLFSPIYIIMIVITIILIIGLPRLLKKKEKEYSRKVIMGILLFSFVMHFLKLVFPPYKYDPLAFRKITAENICALSTLTFPFIFWFSKSKLLKDYMFYFGILSGSVALIFPLEQLGSNFFTFEAIRFYFAHIVLIIAPYLMVYTNQHQLDYKRILKVPLIFLAVQAIIMVNEIILIEIGLVPLRSDDLFDPRAYRNFSLVFGIIPELKFSEGLLKALTPKVFLQIPFGEFAGREKYWPLVWMVVPVYILIPPLCLLLAWPWVKVLVKKDLKNIVNKYYLKNISYKEE